VNKGECCFFYAGASVTSWGAGGGKLFDFGMDGEN
jgi:hypothetical protein